jgi:hypothetical protein
MMPATRTRKFRISELFLVMSTQSESDSESPPFPPESRSTIRSSELLVERLSSKRFLLGKGGAPNTVTELKGLLTMELSGSFELNPNLAADIFPDSSLPFPIDITLIEKLVPSRARTRSTTTRTKKSLIKGSRSRRNSIHSSIPVNSLICNPPPDWSEENVATWLNSIGGALRDAYADTDQPIGSYINAEGQRIIPPKKIWCHRNSKSALEGSPIKRKPDVALLDASSLHKPTWSRVHSVCEVTRTELNKSRTIKDTILQKSYIIITSQCNRSFVPTISFTCGSFTFTACDRTGVVQSETLDVKKHPLTLLRIIVGLMFARPSDIGYDESIECDMDGKAISITIGGKKFEVIEELFMSDSMRGRGTRCWRVAREGMILKVYVLKDSWADVRRMQSEIETLKLIEEKGLCEGKIVPRLVLGEDVCVRTGTDSKPVYIKDSTARRRDPAVKHADERVHCRLLMEPVGNHITTFKSLKELIGAFIDLVEGMFYPRLLHANMVVILFFSA